MANTDVKIGLQGELFVPDVFAVNISPGDSITFYADPDLATSLCMQARTAAILSPRPELTVTIAAGQSVQFHFEAAEPGLYCILTLSADWPYPSRISCGSEPATILKIKPGPMQVWSGPQDATGT